MLDDYVELNEHVISMLSSGEAYRSKRWGSWLIAGSRAEGLALEEDWGHPTADMDVQELRTDWRGVYVPQGHKPREGAYLVYHSEMCPPAYCRLEITDVPSIMMLMNIRRNSFWEQMRTSLMVSACIHFDGQRHWLDTYRAVRLMAAYGRDVVSGPAGQSDDGLMDWVRTFVCSAPHPDIEREYCKRARGCWPPKQLIEEFLQLPMLLVLVGHKHSRDFKLQARLSWSHCEMKLIQELSERVRQGYIACKYVLKHFLAVHRGQTTDGDGRSRVGSFHIKNVFLHFLEKRPPSTITSPFGLFIDLLHELDNFLMEGKLPHYFLAECNLLGTVDDKERRTARRTIQVILADPLTALIKSPTCPEQIYGNIRPDVLVGGFRRMLALPTCEQSRVHLFLLLARLDECRQHRYRKQQETDDQPDKVSGRLRLTGLVNTLNETLNHQC